MQDLRRFESHSWPSDTYKVVRTYFTIAYLWRPGNRQVGGIVRSRSNFLILVKGSHAISRISDCDCQDCLEQIH